MKFAKVIGLALMILFIVSCSKSNDSNKGTTSVEGVWEGKYGTGNNNPSSFYSFNIKPGGILEELNASGQVKGTGTWKLENGNIFSAKYTYAAPSNSKFSIIGAFYKSDGKLLGNWGYGESVTDGGLWEMTKKN